MTSANAKASAVDAVAIPWYDLIDDVPEPPEDAMQQTDTIMDVMSILKARYENDSSTLWSTQSNIIYNSDVPGSVVAPDGYVVFGVDARTIEFERRSYRIDEWGPPPAFVLEVASESTASRDLREKREIYARMGAQEYWRLDKRSEYYGEPLVGERLVGGEYERCELHEEANGDVWARSEVLGVDFYCCPVEGGYFRFLLRDCASGEWLNTLGEELSAHAETETARQAAESARQAAETQARSERQLRQEAEARNEELQRELDRLRGEQA